MRVDNNANIKLIGHLEKSEVRTLKKKHVHFFQQNVTYRIIIETKKLHNKDNEFVSLGFEI